MTPYVNVDITVSHPSPPPVFHRYCITMGKYILGVLGFFFFVACTSECDVAATGLALRSSAELPQIYTASYSRSDGGGGKSWKTTEMREYM